MNENNPLVTELMARAGGASATEAVAAAQSGNRGLGDLPPRTTLVVAASVVAVVAIAATSWGLARHDGKENAAPKAPESSEITFGPNEPAGPSSSLPTLPTLPTFPEASTPGLNSPDAFSTPSYPTSSAPSYPSYTTPTYSYPTSTTPYSPYTTPGGSPSSTMSMPTSSPTTTPDRVYPIAPRATPISKCGTYGSLRFVKTVGVRYELVFGNGRQGPWVVRATARKGYTIATGATTRFNGHLGKFRKCPVTLSIRKVTTEATGDPASDPWRVTVNTTVPKKEKRALSVVFRFETEVTVVAHGEDGWSCTGPGGPYEAGADLTCAFSPPGKQPPAAFLYVRAVDSGSPVAPSGTVTLFAGDQAIDVKSFSAN